MGKINWEEELRKVLNFVPYITGAKVRRGYFEFIFLPNGKNEKQAKLSKHKLEKLINTIRERISLNRPIDIRIENERIIEGKIKYTVRAIPYGCSTEKEKFDLFDDSSRMLCGIIKEYLYKVEHIKQL